MPSIQVQIMINEQRLCKVPGCPRHRYRVGSYCQRHLNTTRLWGHPLAKQIRSAEYKTQVDEVTRLFKTNLDHPGIQHGITFIEKWLDSAANMKAGPMPERVARYRGIVSPRTLLIEVAAVWVYGQEQLALQEQLRGVAELLLQADALIKDETHLRHVLGNKFLIYGQHVRELWFPDGKYQKKPTGKENRETGRLLLVELGPLLQNIYRAVLERRKVVDLKTQAQEQSFTI